MSSFALSGIRVVDLSTVLMGPVAARTLGDHGADVIRVEPPGAPPEIVIGDDGVGGIALNFQRNKRSVRFDLKSEAGARAMRDLVSSSDVFVSNMRASALDRLGLSAPELRAEHPTLIHCVANGFAADSPNASLAAYDDAIQAASGIAGLFEDVHGEPAYVPMVLVDKVCSMAIVQAVLAALLHRERSGEGQTIELSMFDQMVAFNLTEHFRGAALIPPKSDVGYKRLLTKQRRPYRCADGWAAILPYSDANWRDFFTIIERPELIDQFATHAARVDAADEVYSYVAGAAPSRTVAEWLAICEQHSIPAAPLGRLADLVDDPDLADRGVIETHDHPTLGPYRNVTDPTRYDTLTTELRRHAPNPGEHTAEVMAELGWSAADIDALG